MRSQKWADSLVERLRKENKLIDVAIDADDAAVPGLFVDLDRAAMQFARSQTE